jgi:hypothetical protein
MPLLFFIDKDYLDDPSCRGIEDVVLSYTFFRLVGRICTLDVAHVFTEHGGTQKDNSNPTPLRKMYKIRLVLVDMRRPPRAATARRRIRLHSPRIM